MGGICLSKQKIVYESAKKVDEQSIQSFLYRLRRQHPGNYKVHVWKLMHEQVTYNCYYETFLEFSEAIKHFFRHIGKKTRLLSSGITDNFQLLEPIAISSNP